MLHKKMFGFITIILFTMLLITGCGNTSSTPTTSSAPAKSTSSNPTTSSAPASTPNTTPAQKSVPAAKSVEIQQGWQWTAERNYDYVRGSVKNIGDKPIEYFEVTAEYLDANGNVLDTDYTNCNETLRPGNQKKFEIMHKTDPSEKKVRIFISKATYK